jgi:putative tricarboxylic transport membrane protein
MDFSVLQNAGPALVHLLTGPHLLYLLVGAGLGMIVGILPGIGGIAGLAMVLPFIFGMEPEPALAVMVGLFAVTATADTFSSVLIGVPGGAGTAATVLDGFPMTKRGEAARALSAAFASSFIGGLVGAFILTFAFVAARPILLAVGFGEQLMFIVLALTLVGMLTGENAVKGLASCSLGLLLGTIGASQATAEYRFTLDTIYLSDGIPLVIVALGAFALPEVVDVMRQQGGAIAQKALVGEGWITGIRDVINNFWLVIRCSLLGSLIGVLPGLGGGVVGWISYAHTVQSSKDRSQFGKGDVRGVIGPESANNAKDSADLIPTLFFGIPSSGSMAVFMGGLVVIGITPGRDMVTNHVDLIYLIIWSLAISNVLGTAISMILARPIASLTAIRFVLIAPFIIVMIFMSAYQAKIDWGDILALLVVGVVGIYMKRFGWSRAALLIGLVLSQRLEASLYRTVQIYGMEIFERPIAIGVLCLAVISIVYAMRSKVRTSGGNMEATYISRQNIGPQVAFTVALLLFAVAIGVSAIQYKFLASIFPLIVAGITAILLLITTIRMLRRSEVPGLFLDADAEMAAQDSRTKSTFYIAGLLAALPALAFIVGFVLAAPIYVFFFLRKIAGSSFFFSLALALGLFAFIWMANYVFQIPFAPGYLREYITLPEPFG